MNHRELVEALFEEFDENGDGKLSKREFRNLVQCMLGEHGIETSSRIFDRFDTDHDNAITREELVELVIEFAI